MATSRQFGSFRFSTAFAVIGFAFAVKFVFDLLPDAAVAALFMRPSAKLAAIYWGAAFDPLALTLTARGVTLEVVRACSATDFFAMVLTLFAFTFPFRALALRLAAVLAAAWIVAVLSNAVRLFLLVFVDGMFPKGQIPAIHMVVGITVFLTVFGLLWYTCIKRKDSPYGHDSAE